MNTKNLSFTMLAISLVVLSADAYNKKDDALRQKRSAEACKARKAKEEACKAIAKEESCKAIAKEEREQFTKLEKGKKPGTWLPFFWRFESVPFGMAGQVFGDYEGYSDWYDSQIERAAENVEKKTFSTCMLKKLQEQPVDSIEKCRPASH